MLGLRRAKLDLQVKALEIDLDVKRKQKIDIDHAATVVASAFAACRSRLLALPSAIAPVVVGLTDADEVRRVLVDAVEDALRELSADALA